MLAIRTAVVAASVDDEARRWRRHAATTQVLLWGALLIALPASLAFAWLRGASLFCF